MIDKKQLAKLHDICNTFKDGVLRVNLNDHDENSFVLRIERQTATRVYEIELTFALNGAEVKVARLLRGGTTINHLFRTEPSQIYEWTQKND